MDGLFPFRTSAGTKVVVRHAGTRFPVLARVSCIVIYVEVAGCTVVLLPFCSYARFSILVSFSVIAGTAIHTSADLLTKKTGYCCPRLDFLKKKGVFHTTVTSVQPLPNFSPLWQSQPDLLVELFLMKEPVLLQSLP